MVDMRLYAVVSKEALDKTRDADGHLIVGKMGAQFGHAYLHSVWDAMDRFPEAVQAYRDSNHAYKIALVVDTEADLIELVQEYAATHGVTLVKDAGFTVYAEPTITCVGIGPISKEEADKGVLGKLKTLRSVKPKRA